jgi:hypothetical protein
MRKPLFIAAAAAGVATYSADANAGGLGVVLNTGLRSDKAYYYDLDDEQYIDKQMRPTNGFGVEMMLGDRSDPIQGLIRGSLVVDSPVKTPADAGSDDIHPDYDELSSRKTGVMAVGIQWGIWGDPEGFQLIANSLVGTGFITPDNFEFLVVEPGFGFNYTMQERYQLNVNLAATARYRKTLSMAGNLYAGFRYMFD